MLNGLVFVAVLLCGVCARSTSHGDAQTLLHQGEESARTATSDSAIPKTWFSRFSPEREQLVKETVLGMLETEYGESVSKADEHRDPAAYAKRREQQLQQHTTLGVDRSEEQRRALWAAMRAHKESGGEDFDDFDLQKTIASLLQIESRIEQEKEAFKQRNLHPGAPTVPNVPHPQNMLGERPPNKTKTAVPNERREYRVAQQEWTDKQGKPDSATAAPPTTQNMPSSVLLNFDDTPTPNSNDIWAQKRDEFDTHVQEKCGLTNREGPNNELGWYALDRKDDPKKLSRKFTCEGPKCMDLLQTTETSFLQQSTSNSLADDGMEHFVQDCFCQPMPMLRCKQVCDCHVPDFGVDGVIYGRQEAFGHNLVGYGKNSFLQVGDDDDEQQVDGLDGNDEADDEFGDQAGGFEDDFNNPTSDEYPQPPCREKHRWCEEDDQCCEGLWCDKDGICNNDEPPPPAGELVRTPRAASIYDETYLHAGNDTEQYKNESVRRVGAPPVGHYGPPPEPVVENTLPMECECNQYECEFNSTCACHRTDEWETYRCALMGLRGRAVRLNGRGNYMSFRRPPIYCSSFTLEMWVRVRSQRPWARLFDIGNGMHHWLMITPKGWGWWGTIAAWNYFWRWGWVHTDRVPPDEWTHVSLIFGYWHVCVLINGEYRHCHWNHWLVRNAWRYWAHRNWIGRSQYWWDPTLNADVDEVRMWCGWRGGYWIQKYMYQIITDRPWNLVGYWRMDEQAGIVARDIAGDNHLILWDYTWKYHYPQINRRQWPQFIVSDVPVFHRVIGCPKDLPKGPGYALNFRGSNIHPAFLLLSKEMLHLADPDFTVEFWVRLPAWRWGRWERLLDIGYWWHHMKRMIIHGGNPNGRFVTPFVVGSRHPQATRWRWDVIVAPALPRNRWVHVAVTRSGSTGTIFIDGRQVAGGNLPVSPKMICGHHNFIGRSTYWWDWYLAGELDEYRFWNYARSANEIQLQRKVRLTGDEPGLVAYYGFDEGGGGKCFDATANHFDIPLYGYVGYVRSSAPLMLM